MTQNAFLLKVAGRRPGCSCGCCGAQGSRRFEDEDFGFDLFLIIRLIVSALIFAAALIVRKIPEPWPPVMLIGAAVIAGYDLLAGAVLAVLRGDYFDSCILIPVTAVLAFFLEMPAEGAALVLLFQLGGSFIDYAFMRTGQNVLTAVACGAETAHLIRDGAEECVPAEQVVPGDRIVVYPGEQVPCDCIILEGGGSLDLSPLGGGLEPKPAAEGDELLSGCLCRDGTLTCEATAARSDSAAAALLKAVAAAADKGSPVPGPVRRFLSLYPAVTVAAAVIIAGILPLAGKVAILSAIRRAVVFLVIANPCAMFVALPLIRFCSVGRAAKNGILFSGIDALQAAGRTGAVVFDRSGSLTDGIPRVTSIKSGRMDADIFLKIAAHALAYADNPVSRAVIAAYGGTVYIELVENFTEIPGKGVEVYVDGVRICAGGLELMADRGIAVPEADLSEGQAVYVSIAAEYAGRILLADSLREDAAPGVAELGRQGIETLVMLSGEPASVAAKSASELGIREYYAGCDQEQKRALVAEIRSVLSPKRALMFVGGGEGDHTAADLDVSIGDLEALGASSRVDLTILNGRVSALPSAVALAKYSDLFAYGTIAAVLAVKLAVLALGVLGIATLWFAVFIDSAAALGAILFSIRVLNAEPAGDRREKRPKQGA